MDADDVTRAVPAGAAFLGQAVGAGWAVVVEGPSRSASDGGCSRGGDPWRTLLWANGRQPLGDLPRRSGWRWSPDPRES
ncbi:hypothetical protein ACQPZF_34150 [Actinosynnema sp. CS-041913]|uniref:hypothetical protein n=1 Tax=Actinosynnema sp. CS-041913 TaxID=3239917 RepID=UPI003D8E565E